MNTPKPSFFAPDATTLRIKDSIKLVMEAEAIMKAYAARRWGQAVQS